MRHVDGILVDETMTHSWQRTASWQGSAIELPEFLVQNKLGKLSLEASCLVNFKLLKHESQRKPRHQATRIVHIIN